MTNNEAIKVLLREKARVEDVNGNTGGEKVRHAYDMAMKALLVSPETEWIPVSESLPSKDGKYLVSYEGSIIGTNIDILWYGDPFLPDEDVSGKHFYRSGGEFGDIICDEVTAWMPLPKPYKGCD